MRVVKSVPKPQRTSAGAPTPKDPDLVLVKTKDILAWPAVDAGGVNMLGSYVTKPGATMHKLYTTPSKTGGGFESEGDEDAVGVMQKVDASHPGNSVEIREFILAALGEDFIIIQGTCRDNNKTVYGTKCSPMKLKPTFADNSDGTTHTFVFEQYMRTDQVPYNYTGSLTFDAPFNVPAADISLLQANGLAYQLTAFADELGTALDIAALDMEHGKVVSLIGGGGAEPAVLSGGAATAAANVTVILKEDTDWTALLNATITLEVFVAGATTYLIERSRA
jgi:hypothetical protein